MSVRRRLRCTYTYPSGGGSATVTWDAPIFDLASIGGVGGTALADLSGYYVYKQLGSQNGSWVLASTVSNPATLTATVNNLASGTWYFTVSSYDSNGYEGPKSYAGSKTI